MRVYNKRAIYFNLHGTRTNMAWELTYKMTTGAVIKK